jgi:hypothetical protein
MYASALSKMIEEQISSATAVDVLANHSTRRVNAAHLAYAFMTSVSPYQIDCTDQ